MTLKSWLPGLGGSGIKPAPWSASYEAMRAKQFRFSHSPDGLWLAMTFDLEDGKSVSFSLAVGDMEAFEKELTRELAAMVTILNRRAGEADAAVKLISGK